MFPKVLTCEQISLGPHLRQFSDLIYFLFNTFTCTVTSSTLYFMYELDAHCHLQGHGIDSCLESVCMEFACFLLADILIHFSLYI